MTDLKWTPVTIRLGEIEPWSDNPRMSTKAQAERLIQSERELGQVQTVAVGPVQDNGKHPLYDGHQRVSAWFTIKGADFELTALQSNRPLTEDERRKMAVLLHTATGGWNWDKLSGWRVGELKEWGLVNQENVKGWNTDALNVKELLKAEQETQDAEPQIDRAAELLEKWGVQTGDLWQIGEHRLICGDSSIRADVERLLCGEKAALVMADPPYNVKYTGGSTNDKARAEIYQDDMTDEQYTEWLSILLGNGFEFSDDKAALLLWFASAKMRCILDGFEGGGWTARTLIVWNKLKAHYGALGAQYKHKYEPMWYCHKPHQAPRFFGETNETTVWDFEQPRVNELHPTMKPIELYERCVKNHSEVGDVVIELFSGSGTTIVACENLHRKARAIELDPKYVAVALERMAQAFPELEIKRL